MKLKQYKDIIHKCSKCGLCQETCPIYRLGGNECATARGMLILLKGILNKEVPIKKELNKYLDSCLRCGNCTRCCPSEIPVEDIIFAAKRRYLYSTFRGLLIRIKQSAFVKKYFLKPRKVVSQPYEKKTVYLGSRVQDVVKILNANGIALLNVEELSWGLEYLLSGNIIRFRKNFREVLDFLIKSHPDFIVTDIPLQSFESIVKIYTSHEFKLDIRYLGEFEGAEDLVCKYYNPDYAAGLLKAQDNQ